MASWMVHLRVADELLKQIESLDEQAFVMGNIAPDSGVPNEDWTVFQPPKDVSHFSEKALNKTINIEKFTSQYFNDHTLAVVSRNTCKLYDTDRWETWNKFYGINDLLCFSPNGKYLIAKSDYGTKILDLEFDAEKTFHEDFYEACMNIDGSRIITYDSNGVVRVYLSETGSLIYSLMADEEGNYIVYTSEGYCDGTEDGIKKYGRAVKGLELLDNRVLVETFYRSDLMKKVP